MNQTHLKIVAKSVLASIGFVFIIQIVWSSFVPMTGINEGVEAIIVGTTLLGALMVGVISYRKLLKDTRDKT